MKKDKPIAQSLSNPGHEAIRAKIKTNEQWLHEEVFNTKLQKALTWAKNHQPQEIEDPVAFLKKLRATNT